MNGYVCFYKRQRYEVYADTTWSAIVKLGQQLKLKQRQLCEIACCLAEKKGEQVIHNPAILG